MDHLRFLLRACAWHPLVRLWSLSGREVLPWPMYVARGSSADTKHHNDTSASVDLDRPCLRPCLSNCFYPRPSARDRKSNEQCCASLKYWPVPTECLYGVRVQESSCPVRLRVIPPVPRFVTDIRRASPHFSRSTDSRHLHNLNRNTQRGFRVVGSGEQVANHRWVNVDVGFTSQIVQPSTKLFGDISKSRFLGRRVGQRKRRVIETDHGRSSLLILARTPGLLLLPLFLDEPPIGILLLLLELLRIPLVSRLIEDDATSSGSCRAALTLQFFRGSIVGRSCFRCNVFREIVRCPIDSRSSQFLTEIPYIFSSCCGVASKTLLSLALVSGRVALVLGGKDIPSLWSSFTEFWSSLFERNNSASNNFVTRSYI